MAESKHNMDAFERQLKESLEHYEVPYNSADWAQMERALASGVRGWGHGRALTAGLLVAGALLIGGTAYFLGRDNATAPVDMAAVTSVPAPQTATANHNSTTGANALTTVQTPVIAEHQPLTAASMPPATPVQPKQNKRSEQATTAGNAGMAAAQPVTSSPTPASPGNSGLKADGTMFRASQQEACPGNPVDFTVENMPEDGIYLWNFGDGSFSNKPNPQHTFTKPGNYQVMLSMSSAGIGTIRNKPSSDMIVIHEAPAAGFNVIKQDFTGQLPTVHFENRSLGGESFHWDLGDGTVSTMADPEHVYRKKGVYKVELSVMNETGCVDRKMQEVRVDRDFDLGAPESFSPNGDGKDETFMPQSLIALTAAFNLSIYDPAGLLMYNTSDPSHPWCGKMNNRGAVSAPGEYVWMVDVETGAKTPETFTGKVTLVK